MKKLYSFKVFIFPILLLTSGIFSYAQCPAGSTIANVNWDNLDYLTRNGTYAAFVPVVLMQNQKFTIGKNRLSIVFPATITTAGDNTTNTAEAGSFGAGADVEYNGNGSIIITFDTVVYNMQFSLYDIDLLQSVRITSLDGSAVPLIINMNVVTAGVISVAGNGTTIPTATATNTALLNTDTRGTLNISIAGNNPLGTKGIKSVTIATGFGGGSAGDFWLSDLAACVFGSFPLNYYLPQQPWIGQPAYYLVTPDNNSVYIVNPITGRCDWMFSEPASPWVNSLAYDHVNKILYYVMDHPSPLSTNKSLKKYDFNTETISTVIADLTTIGIPLFDIVVESAGAAFYNGALFLGIEGTNSAKNSNRESIVWRIDFNAAQVPIQTAQVYARPADNGAGTLQHDWGDFTIKDGLLYDFNTGNQTTTAQFIHFNMQNGGATIYNTGGTPAPIQAGQTWDGKLYWTGGQGAELGRIALYNENGTIGAKVSAVVTACSPAWVNHAGDASDPFKPKSDFGDAPDSYDPVPMDKATHEFDCNLRLGPTYDREWDKTSSANATADGTDEDGITTLTVLTTGVNTYVQDVNVFNNTGANATIAGWLDYNGNGIFEPAEGVVMTVPTNAAMQTVTLSWPGINVLLPPSSYTFLRIRLSSATNGMTVNNPTQWFMNGEVEDYRVFVDVVLPIQLLSFTARVEPGKKILLSWKTGQEINFNGFEIERSQDRSSWSNIGFVASTNGQQINNYSLLDADPFPSKSYYRLKLMYADGNFSYSEIRMVQLESTTKTLDIIPNPVRDHATLQFTLAKNEIVHIYVIDASGRNVLYKQVPSTEGLNRIEIDNWKRFAPGMYVVQLISPSKKMSAKITVQ
jgi:GEVED domain-containing protein/type IX secretion system substrate protein